MDYGFKEEFIRVYGLPYTEKVHVINTDNHNLYGFSWISSENFMAKHGWKHDVGTFEYVYGRYTGLSDYFNIRADLSPGNIETPKLIHVFFELDDDMNPIEIINNVSLSPEMQIKLDVFPNTATIILTNITATPNQTIAPLLFEM
jgi:hypothetical protein